MKPRPEPSHMKRNAAIAGCIAITLGALAYTFLGSSDQTGKSADVYYLDLNTSTIFVAPANSWPPVETPSGPHEKEPAGVRVYLFSCEPCKDLNGKTLDEAKAMGATALWIEKYKPDAKKRLEEGDRKPETLMEGLLMRAPSGTKWLSPSGREGVALRKSVAQLCPGKTAVACTPN